MEHALVGRGLGALEIVSRRLEGGKAVPLAAVQNLMGFLQVFGDRYHLAKEEGILMRGLEEGCVPGPRCDVMNAVGEVDRQHEAARRLLRSMQLASVGLEHGRSRHLFVRCSGEYIALMRLLIAEEKDTLIRTASSTLAERDGPLERSFRRYLAKEEISETPEQFASEIDGVLSKLSIFVPPARARAYARGTIPYHRSTSARIRY